MLPTVDFFGAPVTRLILGDNPFNGHSYIPEIANGGEMMDYYTADNALKAMFAAEAAGLNTMLPLGDPFILRILRQYRNEGGKMNLIFQPYPAIPLPINARMMMQCKPLAIYHQGTTTDGLTEAGKFDVLRDNLKCLKDTGRPVGLGTHVPETILRSEEEGWGVDFYAACLHNARTRVKEESGFITGKEKHLKFFAEDRPEMLKVVRQVNKPFIVFKVMAGGQLFYDKTEAEIPGVVEGAFREVFDGIKPCDMAAVGVYQKNKNQLAENAEILRRVLAGMMLA